jgi:hypothetical protein
MHIFAIDLQVMNTYKSSELPPPTQQQQQQQQQQFFIQQVLA